MELFDLFPDIPAKDGKEVHLNAEARTYLSQLGIIDQNGNWTGDNPLIVPEGCEKLVQYVHARYGVLFSYGGYLESRDTLWHGTYLDETQNWTHLGIDINVPAGTRLTSPVSGTVIVADHDRDHPSAPQNHGWGNRIILQPDEGDFALIFAHLAENTRIRAWAAIEKWQEIGTIGDRNENGGWFEHFHIQAVSIAHLNELIRNDALQLLDGYAQKADAETRATYPDPFGVF